MGAKSQRLQGFSDGLPQWKIAYVQVEFSGFDPGEIKYVVDEG